MPWLRMVTQGSPSGGAGASCTLRPLMLAVRRPPFFRETKRVPVAELLERRIDRQVTERPAELRAIEGLQILLGADSQAAVRDPDELTRG